MYEVIVSPFLGGYLAVRPGSTAGIRLPEELYDELRDVAAVQQAVPAWLAQAGTDAWGISLAGVPANEVLLVRERSDYGFGRASWEINLGCNFGCKHCYLGLKEFSGLDWDGKVRLLEIMRDAGVLWLQVTGGEPTIDRHFQDAYRYAWELGMMLTISTNASRLWEPSLLDLFGQYPPYRLVVSVYGATEESFDGLTQRRGAWKSFRRGVDAAREAGLPLRLNIVVTADSAHELDAMTGMAEDWGLDHHVYTNMTPTIYGGPESLLAQSGEHLRQRTPFQGCNAGHTFFHADPHARVSICKVGRDDQIDLMTEGIEGLRRLPGVADKLMLRTGGCAGCQLSGTCLVCRPLAKQYQDAKAPLASYCQHGQPSPTPLKEMTSA